MSELDFLRRYCRARTAVCCLMNNVFVNSVNQGLRSGGVYLGPRLNGSSICMSRATNGTVTTCWSTRTANRCVRKSGACWPTFISGGARCRPCWSETSTCRRCLFCSMNWRRFAGCNPGRAARSSDMHEFQRQQRAVTAWLRHPADAMLPVGMDPSRLQVYRSLFFNNMAAFVESAFPGCGRCCPRHLGSGY